MDLGTIKKEFGFRIKSYRMEKNLTQEEFCAIINLSQSNLSNIENGKTFPDFETVCSLISKTKIEPNYLFGFLQKKFQKYNSIDLEIMALLSEMPQEAKYHLKNLLNSIKNN